METNGSQNNKTNNATADEFGNLQSIVNELKLAGYQNEAGLLIESAAFNRLAQLARTDAEGNIEVVDDIFTDNGQVPEEPFHIEADIYDSGDYANLLVIPVNGTYVVVGNDEHLATLTKSCNDPACWEQQEGGLDEELIEKLGTAIDAYSQSF